MEWSGPRENNNGSIRLAVSQAAEALGCNPETARKALADHQRKGFIVVTRCAALGTDGEARGHEYELTELARPPETRPRRLYLEWKPGEEFPVIKATAPNPTGRGGLKFRNPTYAVSSAELTGPEGPNLHGKSNGAEKGPFRTYAVSCPYLPGGAGETGEGDHHHEADDLTSPGARGEAARRLRDLEDQVKELNGHQPSDDQLVGQVGVVIELRGHGIPPLAVL